MDGVTSELTSPRLTEWDLGNGGSHEPELDLLPVLFSGYRDLAKLRHDYPLILVEGDRPDGCLQSLTGVLDAILKAVAPPGVGGERQRQDVLKLEAEIKSLLAGGTGGRLSWLWRRAADDLVTRAEESERKHLARSLELARDRLEIDGEVVDCDWDTPVVILTHAWNAVHATKARAFRRRVEALIQRLWDILKADFMKSDKARSPQALRASVGAAFEADFDFEALSRVLSKGSEDDLLSEDRRRRIRAVLQVLQSQRFYAPGRASGPRPDRVEPHGFVFDSCAAALEAFRDRLPEMVDFIKAVTIAELEIENRYEPARHDAFFARFDETELGEDELALFPSYLVCLRDGRSDAAETAQAFEAIASGLPVKVLIQTDDVLGDPSPEPPRAAFGGGSARLAAMAMGANHAYVLQAPASALYRSRGGLLKGLTFEGPALFSIYSGATESVSGVPPYLLAAAALESRTFPAFSYDPSAGPDWASRFDLAGNPQPEARWPEHRFAYEDQEQQRAGEAVAFSYADFAACDARYAKHRVPVTQDQWHETMTPVGDYLALENGDRAGRVPYLWTIDTDATLRRTVVDEKLVQAAKDCADLWRSLQELGGINNSHAERLVAREREAWNREREEQEIAPAPPAPEPPAAEAPAESAVAAEPEAAEEETVDPDAPHIETARCTTCNECTEINGEMFAYNDDMQAYIADLDAGTYRQLVEAAESCQVSIISPGKPRNPDEPGLDELLERAAPFN